MGSRRRFDKKFKQRLCELIVTKTCSIQDLSKQYGISDILLSRWYRLFIEQNGLNQQDNKQIHIDIDSSKNELLLKIKEQAESIEDLKKEVLILKKAINILART